MKKLLLLIVISVMINFTTVLNAQQNTFSKVIKDVPGYGIQAYSVVPGFDNSCIMVGDIHEMHGIIIKVDMDANVVWNKYFYTGNPTTYSSMHFKNVIATNDSCFLIIGQAYNVNNTNTEVLCIKINSDGDTLWSKAIGQNNYNLYPASVQQTIDSGYVVVGSSSNQSSIFVAKIDVSGNLMWMNNYFVSSDNSEAYSIKQTQDGAFFLSGHFANSSPWIYSAFLLKISQTGEYSWAKKYNLSSSNFCSAKDMVITNDGFLFYLRLDEYFGVMKTDLLGNIVFNKSYDIYSWDTFENTKFHKTSDSSYIFVTGGYFMDGTFTKIDIDGNLIWTKGLVLMASDVFETINKEFFIIGNGPLQGVKEKKIGEPQIGIIKTDSLGNEEDCGFSTNAQPITDTIIASPATFTSMSGGFVTSFHPIVNSTNLSVRSGCVDFLGDIKETESEKEIEVFPNPSKGIFTFDFINEKEAQIEIYNIFGEIVYQAKLNNQKPEIDLSSKAKGIYFYKLLFPDNKISTGKLIII